MVLISTPACNKWVAVVWRIVWGLTRFARSAGSRADTLACVAFDQAVNSKACYGSSAAIKKDEVRCRASIDEWKQHGDSFGPKGATTEFVPFTSDELLSVEEGSLYPALHRMEQSGWIRSEWKVTETNRKAKYYKLTIAGQKELQKAEKSFEQLIKGIRAILRYA
jgi:hypothetical protein